MTTLVDTDVLIDCLRGSAAAEAWLRSCANDAFQVPGVVAMELVIGCRNRKDLDTAARFLSRFEVVWPEASEFRRAFDLLAAHRLKSGMSIPDCLVAAMALTRSAKLMTFNVRHFAAVEGLSVEAPYGRQ